MSGEQAALEIHDPLSLDVERQAEWLLSNIPLDSPHRTSLTSALASRSPAALLQNGSHLLLQPSLTLLVARAYGPLLMDLCGRWIDGDEDEVKILEALGLLIEVHEELYPCVQ